MAKNIEMNYKQGESEYEVLYPNVKVESVIDIEEHYYTKNEINGQISDIIPNPYGVLAIKATDDEGNPVSVQLTVNPKINNSSTITTDSGSGLFVVFVNPGTYKLTAPAGSDFIEYNIDVPSAQVKTNQVTNVNVGVNVVQSGEIEITNSKTIQFPANFNIPVDIWGCGGGGGGGIWKVPNQQPANVGGGGGGYTKMAQGVFLSGKSLQITLGSGGQGINGVVKHWNEYTGTTGNSGGNTIVKADNSAIFTAKGGGAGEYGGSSTTYNGGNGGSGGGGSPSRSKDNKGDYYTNEMCNGGEDGNDAYRGNGMYGGTGQKTTTKIFGDSSRKALCSGGGGAACRNDYSPSDSFALYGQGGEGAGDGYSYLVESDEDMTVPDVVNATTYGSGGGAVALGWKGRENTAPDKYPYSGSGKQGVVFIRWPSQST